MKTCCIILLYIFCIQLVSGQTDSSFIPVSYTYQNGTISSSGFLRDGKPDGYWKAFYENGRLKAAGNRLDFMLDGVWKFYSDSGTVSSEITYEKGIKNGIRRTYLKDEILEEYFIRDVRENYSKTFYTDGKLKRYIPIVNGLEHGTSLEYNRDGVIILICEYKKGFLLSREHINRLDPKGLKQGLWKDFYANGKVQQEITYLNDKKNGYLKKYDDTGTLISIEKYINDEPVKFAEELKEFEIRRDYYPSGIIKIEGSYFNNKPDGVRREYDSTGAIVKAYIFSQGIILGEGIIDEGGKKQGPWKEYYETGELMAFGAYRNNERVGSWVFYHKTGIVEQKGSFTSKGISDGEWNFYYESGNLLKKENYSNGELQDEYIEYSDSGEVLVKGLYVDGYETGEWMYAIGDVIETGQFQDGVEIDWWEQRSKADNKLIFKGKYADGLPEGKHTWYYPDGSKRMEGYYSGGIRNGEWKYFLPDGSLSLITTYKQGIEIKYNNVVIKPELDPTEEQ